MSGVNVIPLCRFNEISGILKASAHPVRLCILGKLLAGGECNVAALQHCTRKPQATVSQHLRKLKAMGIITSERRGTEVFYSLTGRENQEFVGFLMDFNQKVFMKKRRIKGDEDSGRIVVG
ncbi:MAG: metalloregulator ArsR/SmtB family transcription factor [Deltaproteobacteria bacterium]|jgi:ArsR family transcriptional regulator|nr:metalloregulator ArsR/SmtB family transcription factor [Deltaproteobacteria bacterium]